MTAHETIDAHAHIYPEGCFSAVVKTRADFRLVDNPRGQSLLYRGSHVMSMPADQDNLPKRLASMDQAGITMAILSVGALNVGWSGAGAETTGVSGSSHVRAQAPSRRLPHACRALIASSSVKEMSSMTTAMAVAPA